ncbi:serine hydrolase domain-containing protein [Glacieibacterium megasporae]|uniref:serine hydrolase domain-containing protein n=1 Tax=Glacieibacterium megasporae TaxID=2835787 RepID=UPI001C1DE2BF|nr:serine hydrolase domain-containing protein [Polymorphobacter megasporae]UAJ10609.1 beta-lactamase family protein [Polymorphobacter megasporae]
MQRAAWIFGLVALVAATTQAQDRASVGPSLTPPAASTTVLPARDVPPGSPAHALTKSDVDAWLDGYMPYALHTGDIPGAVVTIVADGRILTARGFGYADRDKRTPVDPERTLFRPGSVSKLFTWTAVMQQVEAGRLNLDADVNTYLDFKLPPRSDGPVTMRQLMTHTGGFEETAKGIVYFDPKFNQPLGDYLRRWIPKRIFASGTTPAYSNWGTALAAYIVERVSGEKIEDYLDKHIFAPLDMRHSTFHEPLPASIAGDMAIGYPKPGKPSPGFEYVGPGPAGEGSSSGVDMARFMLAQLNGGELDGHRILQPATAAMMHASPLGKVNPRSLIPPLSRMELGFFETNLNGREIVGHLGDLEAFHTSLHLFLREGVGFYVSFNSPGKAGAAGTLRGALFQDFADRYFPNVATPDGKVDAATSTSHARAMAGTWWASRRAETSFLSSLYLLTQATVNVGPKGELVVPSIVGAGGRPRDWVEIAPYVWRDANGHDRLAAQVVGGKPVRWSYDFASPFEVFDRVPTGKSASWILPALGVSLGILLLTFLHWPIAALVRRRYKAMQQLAGPALHAHRATRLLAGLDVAVVAAWGVAVTIMTGSPDALAGGLDWLVLTLEISGAVVFVGAVLASGLHLWLTIAGGRPWTRKVWNLLVFASAVLVVYVAATFNLMTPSVHY